MVYIPEVATGHESWASLVRSNNIMQYVFDRPIVNLWNIPNVGYDLAGTPDNLEGHGAGTPEIAEINSSEICGYTTAADNDSVSVLWNIPLDVDVSKDMNFRVLWSESGTGGSGSALWTVKYTSLTVETDAIAVGATALDTAITADTPSTTADALQWSPWGTLDGGTISDDPGDDFLTIKTYVTLTTITDATAYQLQARYYRKYIA